MDQPVTSGVKPVPPGLFKGQLLNFSVLLILVLGSYYLWINSGQRYPFLFWITIIIPVVHQLYVWLCWRLELRSGIISSSVGFTTYLLVFFILLVCRPITLVMLADADMDTLGIGIQLRVLITLVFGILALYLFYSVIRYFGFRRAAGADHFQTEYRHKSLVREGVFKYVPNAMYTFGFLALWAIAIGYNSKLALIAAAFNHLYIWVHYYTVERIDMGYLYNA